MTATREQAVVIPSRGLITVSWSELDTARQCPMKHDLSYIKRWSKPPRADGPLARGSLWHLMLEAHYNSLLATQQPPGTDRRKLMPADDRLDAAREAVAQVLAGAYTDAGTDQAALDTIELCEWMYAGHVGQYGADEAWQIVAVEHAAQCRLPTPAGKPSRFMLKFKIDLIIRTAGLGYKPKIWVIDHKSGKDLPKDKNLEFDDQFGLYTWSLRKLGHTVFGSIHDAARTFRGVNEATKPAPLDTRFLRSPMYRTDEELDRIAVEAFQTADARYRQQIAVDRAGAEPPRHPDTERCNWRCDFTEGCLLGRKTNRNQMVSFFRSAGFTQEFTRH